MSFRESFSLKGHRPWDIRRLSSGLSGSGTNTDQNAGSSRVAVSSADVGHQCSTLALGLGGTVVEL